MQMIDVPTAGTSVTLSSTNLKVKELLIQASVANTGNIYIGIGQVSSTVGFSLSGQDSIQLTDINLKNVHMDAAVSGESVTIFYRR